VSKNTLKYRDFVLSAEINSNVIVVRGGHANE